MNTIPMKVTEGLTVSVIPNSTYEYLMSSKDVATGYGVSEGNIRNQLHRNKDEFQESKHYGSAVCFSNSGLQAVHNKVFWTKRGIVRLGFFIKSDRARLFRDWAEDLIINQIEKKQTAFNELEEKLKNRYLEPPDYKEEVEVMQSAIMAMGSANKLAERIGMSASVLSLIKKRPWLVSDEKLKGIVRACRNLLSRDCKLNDAAIEELLQVDNSDLRLSLYTRMKQGGLI